MHIVCEDFLRAFYKLFYLEFCDSNYQWKNSVAKVLLAIWQIFLHENNRNYNSYRSPDLVTNLLLSLFCTVLETMADSTTGLRNTQLVAKLKASNLILNLKPIHCSKWVEVIYHLIVVVDRYFSSQRTYWINH